MIAIAKPPGESTRPVRDYISYSSLNVYRQCPLKYYFKYVLGLPEESISANLAFGGAMHSALEVHFNTLLAGSGPPSLVELLAVYRAAWRERVSGVLMDGEEGADALETTARRMLEAFQRSEIAVPQGDIIGVEEELRGVVIPGLPDLLARIDLLVETDDALVVTDFKTARSRWSQDKIVDAGEQLLLYSVLAKRLAAGKKFRLEFAVITKAKVPTVDRHTLSVDPQQVARSLHVVERVWDGISTERFYPVPSAMNCPTCPFREPCRQWPS